MTLAQRLDLLMPVALQFPALGIRSRAEVEQLVRRELGSLTALDEWQKVGPRRWTRVIAPALIYQVCASNLEVSAVLGMWLGLLLGSRLEVKAARGTSDDLAAFTSLLPPVFRDWIRLREDHDPAVQATAEVIVVFGQAQTIHEFQATLRPGQRFVPYGPKASVIWLDDWSLSPSQWSALVEDVSCYDQMGCLSPQAVYGPPSPHLAEWGEQLAAAFAARTKRTPYRRHGLAASALVQEFRDVARARGDRLWVSEGSTDWTVVWTKRSAWEFSSGHRTVWIKTCAPTHLTKHLAVLRGQLSAVGLARPIEATAEQAWIELGVNRFCPLGQMQRPPLGWHHDGRPVLSDLVRWVDREIGVPG